MEVSTDAPDIALIEGRCASCGALYLEPQRPVLLEQVGKLGDPLTERTGLSVDGAAAAQHDGREQQKEDQGSAGDRQPAADGGLPEVAGQVGRDLVELSNGDHLARPGLAHRVIDLQQRLAAGTFLVALRIIDPVEFSHQLAVKRCLEVLVGLEALAPQLRVVGIEDGAVAAPQPERHQPGAERALSECLVKCLRDAVVQRLAGLHVRQQWCDDAVDIERGDRSGVPGHPGLDLALDQKAGDHHRQKRHQPARQQKLGRKRRVISAPPRIGPSEGKGCRVRFQH